MSAAESHSTKIGMWRRQMLGRDPGEPHRASTPLELLFDLCFVVAISQAAAQLHDALSDGAVAEGLLGYAMVFFAIWWAWMNFTWFASAYDTDDALYRVFTLLQMAGVLVLAAGVSTALADYDFTVVTIGYLIMRIAMVLHWLRAAREDSAGRSSALRYALGISVVQIGWLARLALPHPWDYVGFAALVVAELSIPIWAEYRGGTTRWHPEHIAERYGLLTIIVLGEVILATLAGVQALWSSHGLRAPVMLIAAGGLILVFGVWWTYFSGTTEQLTSLRIALVWGYGHYIVFAAIAALGAGLEVAIAAVEHPEHLSRHLAVFAVAVPVAVFLVVLVPLRRLARTSSGIHHLVAVAGALIVLGLGFAVSIVGVGGAVLAMGLAVAATVAINLVIVERRGRLDLAR